MIHDIGANLSNPQVFKNARSEILNACGVCSSIVLTSTDRDSFEKNLQIIKDNSDLEKINLYTTLGWHPHSAKNFDAIWYSEQIKLIEAQEIGVDIAFLGECGLDYNRMLSSKHEQQLAFCSQLEVGGGLDITYFLHERDGVEDFLNICKDHQMQNKKAIVHCFSSDKEVLKKYLDMGFYIGLTGWITDERRNQPVLKALEYAPLDRILFETDCPYLRPRNAPKSNYNSISNISYIVDYYCLLMKITRQEVITAQNENFTKLLPAKFSSKRSLFVKP